MIISLDYCTYYSRVDRRHISIWLLYNIYGKNLTFNHAYFWLVRNRLPIFRGYACFLLVVGFKMAEWRASALFIVIGTLDFRYNFIFNLNTYYFRSRLKNKFGPFLLYNKNTIMSIILLNWYINIQSRNFSNKLVLTNKWI